MSTACATFLGLPRGPDVDRDLLICTAYSSPSSSMLGVPGQHHIEQLFDGPSPWHLAYGARNTMEEAMKRALTSSGSYPYAEGATLLTSLGWEKGYLCVLEAPRSAIKLTLSYDTCSLIPEVVPVPRGTGLGAWLDTVAPIYRTLDHVEQRPVARCPDKSLAIIYQVIDPFPKVVPQLKLDLYAKYPIIDVYPGDSIASNRVALLHEVFHEHRAVLFFGHLARGDGRTGGGWQLTQDDVLSMAELQKFLGGGRPYPHSKFPGQDVSGNPIPEVVFACCCGSAGKDPDTADLKGLSYPKLFLDAGVRFFIGTWMDVLADLEEGRAILQTMAHEFFSRWADEPDNAVEHLYNAKKACQFHLLTSLFQMYSAGGEQAITTGGHEPMGALVSGIAVGDRLGSYVLGSEVWANRYARTFWATSDTNAGVHLLQILADEWQNSPSLAEELQSALQKLAEAELGPGHLIPNRHEVVALSRNGQDLSQLHVLVYDRPPDETAQDWSTLRAKSFNKLAPDHFMEVVLLGAQISSLLSELHAHNLLHGNLDPGSVVFRHTHSQQQAVLKDAWVQHTRPGRCTGTQYAAPEEPAHEEGIDALKYDCWGLGVILFELATGQPPFGGSESPEQGLQHSLREVVGPERDRVPEALDRVISECLMPSAKVRPSAEFIARRLLLALNTGGDYIGDFADELHVRIRAGHRLFAVLTDDIAPLEATLKGLTSQGYHLFTAAEDVGLFDHRARRAIVPWVTAEAYFQALIAHMRQNNLPDPSFPTPNEVASLNATIILGEVFKMRASAQRDIPIVLIRGNGWWDYGPAAQRTLKIFQAEARPTLTITTEGRHVPVIIIADSFVGLEVELARLFVVLDFPPPSPAGLFEEIMAFARTEQLPMSDVSIDTAVQLAYQFFPSSMRELKQALRLCALAHETLDERALEIRDEAREQRFRALGTATYTPVSKLPDPQFIGLPLDIAATVTSWANNIQVCERQNLGVSTPKRVIVTGPEDCGKTFFAQTLAVRTQRPLVRIDAARCLRGRMGESEEALRETLASANALHKCVVLLDDVEKFFGGELPGDASSPLVATMTRMSGILLEWLDTLPPGVIAVMTSARAELLPAQWRRRLELFLQLELPRNESYRRAIFMAVFRRYALDRLTSDADLIQQLAQQTDPDMGIPRLLSPLARKLRDTPLCRHTVQLKTSVDIENWVRETLLLHSNHDASPDTREFWLNALVGIAEEGRSDG